MLVNLNIQEKERTILTNALSNNYSADGFSVIDYINDEKFDKVKEFAIEWVCDIFKSSGLMVSDQESIKNYHNNDKTNEITHGDVLRARNRHTIPPKDISDILINSSLRYALEVMGINNFTLWDEGLGWLAFRLIRPGFNDGYPFSRKDWGPGKGTISIWIPIIGFERNQTIALIPGSHLNEYESYLPENSKFIKDEYRLKNDVLDTEILRPDLEPCQAILFSPKLVHSEDVEMADSTRLSLEFRILPSPE